MSSRRLFLFSSRRYISKTSIESYISPSTRGIFDSWIQKFEDFVGLTQVRAAQAKVLEAESNFEQLQEERRNANQTLTVVSSKLKNVALELEKTSRGTDRYLELVVKENEIIKEETAISEKVKNLEDQVRSSFSALSSALRDSHEKERAQAERNKYLSIIGSISGAVLGIIGSTVNNYRRMKELRSIVQLSNETTEDYKSIATQLCDTVKAQNNKHDSFLADIRETVQFMDSKPSAPSSSKRSAPPGSEQNTPSSSKESAPSIPITATQINDIMDLLKKQDIKLTQELSGLKQLFGERDSRESASNVIYVGPQMEDLLSQTERNLEWKIKLNALATVTFIYGAFALTIPIILNLFKGS